MNKNHHFLSDSVLPHLIM